MIALRPSAHRRVRDIVGAAAVLCGLYAATPAARASPACTAVNSGSFSFSSPASDAASSTVFKTWQTGDKVTLFFTDAISVTHADGIYQGGTITAQQTVTVPSGGNAGFAYTVTGNDLINGLLLDPENSDSVTASCVVTTLLATTTALTTTSNPVGAGASVQFTATVVGGSGTPTGQVAFFDNGNFVTTGTLSGGATTFTLNAASEGFHDITATYLGNATYTSSSAAVLQAVEILSTKPRIRRRL